MGKRGRPRYPDVLTPREWEVLALLREELTNEQIAGRLGITLRTARYHVSEILSKLGVSSREEAAAWEPERRPWWLAASAPLLFWRKLGFGWLPLALAGTALVAVATGLGLLAWGLVRTHGDGASAPSGPPTLEKVARAPDQYVIVYVRPISGPMANVYVRTIDAQTGDAGPAVDLGVMFSGNFALSDAPALHLVAFGPLGGQGRIVPLQGSQTAASAPSSASFTDVVAIGDIVYHAGTGVIVGRDPSDRIVATYPLPEPLPPRGDEPIFTTPTTAMFDRNAAPSLAEIVPTSAGHLLAFVEGITNSVAVDLNTDQRLDLTGYDRVFAATLATDGYAYALVHNAWFPGTGYEVAKIDPVALRVVAQQPMAFNSRTTLPNGFFALARPGGDVYVYIPAINLATCPGTPDGTNLDQCAAESLLYRVNPDTATTTLVPLPPAIGIDVAMGVDGKLYFYGGVGENRVSRYDPMTGQIETDLPSLRAPEGTYVQAVAAR